MHSYILPGLLPAVPALSPVANYEHNREAWHSVHVRLASEFEVNLLDLIVYQYCVYQAFGQEQDAALVRSLCAQLLQFGGPPRVIEADELILLAWLQPRLQAQQPVLAQQILALLQRQDLLLLQQALTLPAQSGSRPLFFAVIRYFSLRLPDPQALNCLRQLLPLRNTLNPSASGLQPLGLRQGQAGELLLLLRLARHGLQSADVQESIRNGILRILAVRREVAFLDGRYSIFPEQLDDATGETRFSPEMSWHHGDLGQAWLLYEAQELLQDAELARIAELIGLNTLLRTSVSETGIVSAQFDRGAAGVATLYRKLYRLSGHAGYQRGYHFWLGQTQQLLTQELAAGLHAQPGDLGRGLVGIGLLLLSALTEQELGWEDVLL